MPYQFGRWIAADSQYRTDRYYRYDDLTELLHRWVGEHPEIVTIASMGKSFEGRDIWQLTITNQATGELVATGSTTQVFLDVETNSLQFVAPDFYNQWLQQVMAGAAN